MANYEQKLTSKLLLYRFSYPYPTPFFYLQVSGNPKKVEVNEKLQGDSNLNVFFPFPVPI